MGKALVGNRGEFAIRAFRAAFELGARTVAVFSWEYSNSEHRLKADEAYEVGERGDLSLASNRAETPDELIAASEASITAPIGGRVELVASRGTQQVEGGDLIVTIGSGMR